MRKLKFGLITWITLFAYQAIAGPMAAVDIALSPAGSFKASTAEVKGSALVKGGVVEAKNIVVNLKKLNSGISLRDDHMKKKYLEVEKFPEAVLVMGKGSNGKGTGVIKIKGISKNIEGTYKVEGSQVMAEFQLKLSDFKISGIRYMGVGVKDEVKISVTVPVGK